MIELTDIETEILQLDKSSWEKVRFGKVAIQQKGRVNRDNTQLTKYVKGEHMGSQDLHLREWGELKDEYLGPAFIRYFEKNDILYGSRRTYLRKVVVAPFEGITSNTTYVIKANEKLIDKRLLPFVMMSEGFTDHSIKNSKGSVNPYVNWKDLTDYEFLLPPKAEQARLAELLWAMDEVIEKEKGVQNKLKTAWNVFIEETIHGLDLYGKTISDVLDELSKKKEVVRLKELGEFLRGRGIPKKQVKKEGIPCVRYGELYTKHHQVIRDFNSFIDEKSKEKSFKLEKNDVLFAGSGEIITEIGKSASFVDNIEAYAGSDILVFRPFEMNGYYLGYLMNSLLVRQQLNKYGTGATIMHIYNSDLKKIKVPLHKKDTQNKIAGKLEEFADTDCIIQEKIGKSQSLQKSLINQIF